MRKLLALAAWNRLHVHKTDIDKAYLHRTLKKQLHTRIQEGINNAFLAGNFLCLDSVLYGSK